MAAVRHFFALSQRRGGAGSTGSTGSIGSIIAREAITKGEKSVLRRVTGVRCDDARDG
jgi:hypothetical protein